MKREETAYNKWRQKKDGNDLVVEREYYINNYVHHAWWALAAIPILGAAGVGIAHLAADSKEYQWKEEYRITLSGGLYDEVQYDKVIKYYDNIISSVEGNDKKVFIESKAEIIASQGNKLLSLDHDQEALSKYNQVIALSPNNLDYYGYKAKVLNKMGNYEEAVSVTNKMLSLDAYNYLAKSLKASAIQGQGNQCLMEGSYEAALSKYEEALQINHNQDILLKKSIINKIILGTKLEEEGAELHKQEFINDKSLGAYERYSKAAKVFKDVYEELEQLVNKDQKFQSSSIDKYIKGHIEQIRDSLEQIEHKNHTNVAIDEENSHQDHETFEQDLIGDHQYAVID